LEYQLEYPTRYPRSGLALVIDFTPLLLIFDLGVIFLSLSEYRLRLMEAGGGERQNLADSVEKVGFSNGLNSGTTTTGEPTHHIEWFFGPSVTFAALLLG
jgi:hypothetical protein